MAAMKSYLLNLLFRCSDTECGQSAIEHGIQTGTVNLTYHLDTDAAHIMQQYDVLVESYKAYLGARETYEQMFNHTVEQIMEAA